MIVTEVKGQCFENMEMIMISPSQLKVMMDPDDMKVYKLSCEENATDPVDRKCALRSILKKAREETGFASDGRRVIVKMFPSRDGGCEMFVMCLGYAERCEGEAVSYPLREGMPVYLFPTFDQLASACCRLTAAGFSGESAAYREVGKVKYYLVVSKPSPLIPEMGGTLLRSCALTYINEHCTLICEGAVALLADYA